MRLNLLLSIGQWLFGQGLSSISAQINAAYQAKLNAQNDEARLEADQRIAQLNAQQSLLIAEQNNRLTRWIRPAFAAPFVIYNGKIILWDKVLGWGVTDPLP